MLKSLLLKSVSGFAAVLLVSSIAHAQASSRTYSCRFFENYNVVEKEVKSADGETSIFMRDRLAEEKKNKSCGSFTIQIDKMQPLKNYELEKICKRSAINMQIDSDGILSVFVQTSVPSAGDINQFSLTEYAVEDMPRLLSSMINSKSNFNRGFNTYLECKRQ